MPNDTIQKDIDDIIAKYGPHAALSAMQSATRSITHGNACTIIVNGGLHRFPPEILVGEVYTFYEGSLDLSDESILQSFLESRLLDLATFLRSRKWKNISVVISGHAAVCMQVKLAIYRITHIESIDWVFDGAGNYLRLAIPMRRVLTAPR